MPMPSKTPDSPEEAKEDLISYATAWGNNSVPPTLTAALIAAQALKPFQTLPMLFPPILLFSSWMNINGYQKDAAGITSAWSAAYLVLARRRKHGLRDSMSARGVVRGATLALCLANIVGGGLAYYYGKRDDEELVEKK